MTARKIRDEIIHNEFFTRLIAVGSTTEEELKKVKTFVPYRLYRLERGRLELVRGSVASETGGGGSR